MREFEKGDRVRYVPGHAEGDYNHPDCEDGIVSSVRDETRVFVKYDCAACTMTTGDEPYTAQLTMIADLVELGRIK